MCRCFPLSSSYYTSERNPGFCLFLFRWINYFTEARPGSEKGAPEILKKAFILSIKTPFIGQQASVISGQEILKARAARGSFWSLESLSNGVSSLAKLAGKIWIFTGKIKRISGYKDHQATCTELNRELRLHGYHVCILSQGRKKIALAFAQSAQVAIDALVWPPCCRYPKTYDLSRPDCFSL